MKHYNRKTLISAAMIFLLISFSSYMSLVIFALYINSKAGILLTSVIVALPNMIRFFSGLLTPKIERMLGKSNPFFLQYVLWQSAIYFMWFLRSGRDCCWQAY